MHIANEMMIKRTMKDIRIKVLIKLITFMIKKQISNMKYVNVLVILRWISIVKALFTISTIDDKRILAFFLNETSNYKIRHKNSCILVLLSFLISCLNFLISCLNLLISLLKLHFNLVKSSKFGSDFVLLLEFFIVMLGFLCFGSSSFSTNLKKVRSSSSLSILYGFKFRFLSMYI